MPEISQHSIDLFQILLWLLVFVTVAFIAVLLYIGKGVTNKLDKIEAALTGMGKTVNEIKEEIKSDIARHDTRISILEKQMEHAVERRTKDKI
jgi:hypothetical protein